jgi:hypothetical protein
MHRLARLFCAAALLGLVSALSAAEAPKLTFAEQEFTLAFVDLNESGVVNRYVPTGERPPSWTSLLTVQQAPQARDPAVMADGVLRVATTGGMLVSQPQVLIREGVKNREDVIVLLLVRDRANFGNELSIQRFVKEPGAIGVKTYIYARRIPLGTDNPTQGQLNAWIHALWEFQSGTHKVMP